MQRNWIGRSQGANIDFAIEGMDQKISVFTTRPDTLYGATFMVLAADSELAQELASAASKEIHEQFESYLEEVKKANDIGAFRLPTARKPVFSWATTR